MANKFTSNIDDEVNELSNFLDDLVNTVENDFEDMYSKMGTEIVKYLKSITPVDSGETRNAWVFRADDRGLRIANTNGGLIELLISGVRPHRIEAKQSKVLSFRLGGSQIFATFVNHPGFGPQMPPEKKIFRKIEDIINNIIEDNLLS